MLSRRVSGIHERAIGYTEFCYAMLELVSAAYFSEGFLREALRRTTASKVPRVFRSLQRPQSKRIARISEASFSRRIWSICLDVPCRFARLRIVLESRTL